MDVTLQGVDLYAVLGVAKDASPEDLKKAFREKSFKHHPDHGGNAAEFATLSLAYNKLLDPDQRAYFDRTGQIKEQSNIEKDAWCLIATVFQNIVDGAGEGIFQMDVIQEMQTHIRGPIKQGRNRINSDEIKIKFLERVKSKITRLDDAAPPALETMLEDKIRDRKKSIADSQDAMELAEMGLKLLKKYKFESTDSSCLGALSRLTGSPYAGSTYDPTTVTRPDPNIAF